MISSSPRRLGAIELTASWMRRAEHVDPDESEVALRLGRLLDETQNVPGGIEFGDAELLRVVDLREQNLRVGTAALELVDQIGDATDDEVVTQVHHEVVVAEEVAGDEDAVRQP